MPSTLKRSLAPILALTLLGACLLVAPVQAAPQQAERGVSGISWLTDWVPTWLQGLWGGFGDASPAVDTEKEEPGRVFAQDGSVLEPDGVPAAAQETTLTPSLRGEDG